MFTPTTEKEITGLIQKSPSKSCKLDPIPTWLLKECVTELAPMITAIVNKSLQLGSVPQPLKHAHVCPLLKKTGSGQRNSKKLQACVKFAIHIKNT